MSISQIITLIIGIILIGFIIWWFFGKHKEATGTGTIVNDEQTATIVVNGGYSPSTVVLKRAFQHKLTLTCVILLPAYHMLSLNN